MDWWLLNFLLGAILSLFLPIVPEVFYVITILIVASCFSCSKNTRKISGLFFGCAWLLSAGAQYENSFTDNKLTKLLQSQQPVIVEGEVLTLPNKKSTSSLRTTPLSLSKEDASIKVISDSSQNKIKHSQLYDYRFNFRVNKIDNKLLERPVNMRLSWGKTYADVYQGQYWQFKVKIKPAHGFANPGGFSYQTWLREKNIVATGYVKNDKQIKETTGVNDLAHSRNNVLVLNDLTLRQKLIERLKPLLPDHDLSALLLALSFGERSHISPNLWQTLQITGTQHLIAISGLHLGLVASSTFFILLVVFKFIPIKFFQKHLKLANKQPSCLLKLNSRTLAVILSCLLTLYYAYLAGFALPTIRALTMLLLYWGVRLLGLKLSLTRWLLIALTMMVITTPFGLFSSSFWLSVYAVIIIFLIVWRFAYLLNQGTTFRKFLSSLLLIQISLSIFMLPASALFNHQISLVSLFANIIAVPVMSITSIPLSLLAVIVLPISESASTLLLQLSLQSLQLIWFWLEYLATFDWAYLSLSSPQIIILAITILGISLGVFLSINRKLFASLILIISTLITGCYVYTKSASVDGVSTWQVNVMDVGQGLAVFIERNGHFILYDTGASYPSGFNLADAVLLPFLKHKGVTEIDIIIISHADNDHAGGLAQLKSSIKVDELFTNVPLSNNSKNDEKNISKSFGCKKGSSFTWQGLTFSVLWPEIVADKKQRNDDSCVIKISDGVSSVLLVGDISRVVEKQLQPHASLSANILIAPHHGSKTSSSRQFLQKVAPQYAVFSTGYLNRWKMPNKQVVDRYNQQNIITFNTADSGMVNFKIIPKTINKEGEEGISVKEYRKHLWPFWFAN